MLKKILIYGGIALVLFLIVTRPEESADAFKAVWGGIVTVATGIGDFFVAILS